jgi:hypothetical protein
MSSRLYKDGYEPPQNTSTPKAMQTTTQNVEYYAYCGPNLSKFYIPCIFEFLISATPHLQSTTSGYPSVGLELKHRQLRARQGCSSSIHWRTQWYFFDFTSTVLDKGTTFVFGSWIYVTNGSGGFNSCNTLILEIRNLIKFC